MRTIQGELGPNWWYRGGTVIISGGNIGPSDIINTGGTITFNQLQSSGFFGPTTSSVDSTTNLTIYGSSADSFSLTLSGSTLAGNTPIGNLLTTWPGDIQASHFNGNGANLTSLDASSLASGTVPNSRLPNPMNVSAVNVGTLTLTNVDSSIFVASSAGLGTNLLLTSSTNYGSIGRTNWTWMNASGWHNTNNSAGNQGVDISKGTITTPNWKTPTNSPTDTQVLTATGTAGDTKWSSSSGGGAIMFGGAHLNTGASTVYVNIANINSSSSVTTATNFSTIMPKAVTLSNLYVSCSVAPLSTTNLTYTIITNGVACSISAVLTGNGTLTTASDITHTETVAAGTRILISVTSTASLSTIDHTWSFQAN